MNKIRFTAAALAALFCLCTTSCGDKNDKNESRKQTVSAVETATTVSDTSSAESKPDTQLESSSADDTTSIASEADNDSSSADTVRINADWTSGEILLDGDIIQTGKTTLSDLFDQGWMVTKDLEYVDALLNSVWNSDFDGLTLYKGLDEEKDERCVITISLTAKGEENVLFKDMYLYSISLDQSTYIMQDEEKPVAAMFINFPVPFSIAGVGFEQSKDDVKALIGQPASIDHLSFMDFASYEAYSYNYESENADLDVVIDSDFGVIKMGFTDKRYSVDS